MPAHSAAFEEYRRTPTGKTTWPRLVLGAALVAVCWIAGTLAVLLCGVYVLAPLLASSETLAQATGIGDFFGTPAGVLTALASFIGIWIGLWAVMRWVHGEKLAALFGNSRRISLSGFCNGLIAVLITSLLSEVLLYLLQPEIQRGTIRLSTWLLFLVPAAALTFLQTSSEELLFRGYLLRALAKLCQSPLVWAILPGLVFTAMHWNSAAGIAVNVCVMISIAAFAALLTLLVYATGNLGASFGAHLGNNLVGLLLISHQRDYNAFALFNAKPLEASGWTTLDTAIIAGIGVVSTALTALLLLHARSPLKVEPDLPKPPA